MPKKKVPVKIREATRDGIPAFMTLNRAACPVLANDNVVWGETHLRSRLRIFPQSQIVAEVGGKILGAVASLLVNLEPDALRHHIWAGITSDFTFARDGIKAEADSNEETVLISDLDLDDLHESRSGGTVTPRLDRRPDLFKMITRFGKTDELQKPDEGPLGDQPQLRP